MRELLDLDLSDPVGKIAVARDTRARGVNPPGHDNGTYDWRAGKDPEKNSKKIRAAYIVMPLNKALLRDYYTDAHLVPYIVPGLARQPRLNKAGVQWVIEQTSVVPVMTVLFVDVDNPDHGEWTDDAMRAAEEQHQSLEILKTCGYYYTRRGRRLFQPLATPISVLEVEPYLRRWHRELIAAGVPVDTSCKDWTRHYRLPNVHRDEKFFKSPKVVVETAQPITLEPLAPEDTQPQKRARVRREGNVAHVEWSEDLPDIWLPRVKTLAEGFLKVESQWHEAFLAFAGALIQRKVPLEHIPAICEAVSRAADDTRTADRVTAARTTISLYLNGQPYRSELLPEWPSLEFALDTCTDTSATARLRAECSTPPVVHPSAEEVATQLEDAIATAPDGVTVCVAGCGVGKTQAAIRVAIKRALQQNPQSTRFSAKTRTSISVPTNKLAVQISRSVREQGGRCRRLFSPISLFDDDGAPVCRYYDAAVEISRGGHSVHREFCEGRGRAPCKYLNTCAAAPGEEGPENAHVTVGNHGLIGRLVESTGTSGILVIDEPPDILETEVITSDELEKTKDLLFEVFEQDFAVSMKPALDATAAWVREIGSSDQPLTDPLEIIEQAVDALDPDDVTAAVHAAGIPVSPDIVVTIAMCVKASIRDTSFGATPPVKRVKMLMARELIQIALQVGLASRVMRLIYRIFTDVESPPKVRLVHRGRHKMLVSTGPKFGYIKALKRQGVNVVLDATPDIPVIEKIIGYPPFVKRFWARDKAEVKRTLIRWGEGNRRYMIPNRSLEISTLVPGLRTLIRWAKEDPATKTLGIITLQRVCMPLESLLRPADRTIAEEWKKRDWPLRELVETKEAFRDVLAEWNGVVLVGHYGSVRGLDHMRDVDALATFGDPWPNLGEVRESSLYLGLPDWNSRMEERCRSELEQAHGRLRAPHRDRSARALHMGTVKPSGPGWDGEVDFRRLATGRPRAESALDPETLRQWVLSQGITLSRAAYRLGTTDRTLKRYISGESPIPQSVLDVVLNTKAVTQTPTK